MRILNTMEVEVSLPNRSKKELSDNAREDVNSLSLHDRESVTVPICPIETPNDEVLYQDPIISEKSYYLPRYEVVTEEVSGEPRYRIEMADSNQGWSLTVYIEPYIAESLIPQVNSATVLDHTLTAVIRYTKSRRIVTKEFDEIESHAGGYRLTMNLIDIEQRDEIFTAISTYEFLSSLIVGRKIEVAIPIEVDVPNPPSSNSEASVILIKIGNKISAINIVRLWTGETLKKSQKLVEQELPATLASGLSRDRANAFVKGLMKAGSKAVVNDIVNEQRPISDAKKNK